MLDIQIKNENVNDVLKSINNDIYLDNNDLDNIFDVYGNYIFPTETNLKEPNMIAGIFEF